MRYLVLLTLLLPFAANATSYNKADCDFLQRSVENCDAVDSAFLTGSDANRGQDFAKRHPVDPLCKNLRPLLKYCPKGK